MGETQGIQEYRDRLLAIAREKSDVELALVATGYRQASNYLLNLTDPSKTNVALANVSKTSKYRIRTIIKANNKRREQLNLWIRREQKMLEEGEGGNEFYLNLYKEELKLLDTYALAALADLYMDWDELSERAVADEAEREERKAANAAKRAAMAEKEE